MKKKLYILMACAAILATDTLFAMYDGVLEHGYAHDSKRIRIARFENITYQKDDELHLWHLNPIPDEYTLNSGTLAEIRQTPIESDWCPPMSRVYGPAGRRADSASYTFLIGEKQFELFIRSFPNEFPIDPNVEYSFRFECPCIQETMNSLFDDLPSDSLIHFVLCPAVDYPYFTYGNTIAIREINLSPENPMFGKGIRLEKYNEENIQKKYDDILSKKQKVNKNG